MIKSLKISRDLFLSIHLVEVLRVERILGLNGVRTHLGTQHCACAAKILCLHASFTSFPTMSVSFFFFFFLDKGLNPSGSCEVPSTTVLSAVSSSRSHHASWHHQHPIKHPPAGRILDAHRLLCWDDASSCVSKPVVQFAQSSGHVCCGRYGPVPGHGQSSTACFSSSGEKPRCPHVPQQSQDCIRVPPCAPNTTTDAVFCVRLINAHLQKDNHASSTQLITDMEAFSPTSLQSGGSFCNTLEYVFNSASGSNHNL